MAGSAATAEVDLAAMAEAMAEAMVVVTAAG